MPEISRFLGIIIYMYFDEHPPPHFHAKYGSYEILVYLDDGVVEGRFPRRALRHVLEAIRKPCHPVTAISSSILAVMKHRATTRGKPIQHKINVTDLDHRST